MSSKGTYQVRVIEKVETTYQITGAKNSHDASIKVAMHRADLEDGDVETLSVIVLSTDQLTAKKVAAGNEQFTLDDV